MDSGLRTVERDRLVLEFVFRRNHSGISSFSWVGLVFLWNVRIDAFIICYTMLYIYRCFRKLWLARPPQMMGMMQPPMPLGRARGRHRKMSLEGGIETLSKCQAAKDVQRRPWTTVNAPHEGQYIFHRSSIWHSRGSSMFFLSICTQVITCVHVKHQQTNRPVEKQTIL